MECEGKKTKSVKIIEKIMLVFTVSLLFYAVGCVTPRKVTGSVALEVSGHVQYFTLLEDAVESVPEGSVATVTILDDVTVLRQIVLPQANVTITDGGRHVTVSRNFNNPDGNRMFVITGSTYLTLEGSDSGSLTITGNSDARMKDSQFFLVGAYEADSKAALFLNKGVTVFGNRTESDGAAALVYGKLVVNGAVMTGNESAGNGGAVHVSGNGDFRIYSGRIKGNRAHNGGGVSVEGNASATISNGEITGNNAGSDGNGGNLYIGSCSQGVLLGGGIDISGGMKGNEGNDISLADGSDEKPTRITLAGHFKGSSISFLGKNVRVKITADLKASVLNVASNEPFTEDERNLIIEGVHASDQYGALRFSGGRMFNDSQNVRIRFYASPIKQSQWGDATYIEFPDGTNMLVDCGSQDTGEAIARELWNLGIYRIDVVVLTHYHSDHANGLHGIFESAKISVGTFVSTSYIPKTGYAWIDEDLRVYGGSRKYVSTGDSFELGGALFSILWPDADQLSPVPDSNTTDAGGAYSDSNPPVRGGSLDMNSKTIVMMLQYGENKVLFTGDIYANRVVYNGAQNWDYSGYDNPNSEEYLVLRYEGTDVLKADIMTAPHHGKRTSSSEALIKAVSPSYAVAMGTANQKDINSRYEQFGAILYRTGSAAYDYSGTLGMNVYAVLDGSSVRVTVGEPEK